MDDLKRHIREVPDFPKPGILFYDITTLLANPLALRQTVDRFVWLFASRRIDKVVGMESRGFLFGPIVAYDLLAGFVPVRPQRPGSPRGSGGEHAPGVLLLEADRGAGTGRGRAKLHPEPVASALDSARSADDDACLALDEPRPRVARAMHLVAVVRGVRPEPGLGRLPGEALRRVLRPTATGECDEQEADAEGDPHDPNLVPMSRSELRTGGAREPGPSCRRDRAGSTASPG